MSAFSTAANPVIRSLGALLETSEASPDFEEAVECVCRELGVFQAFLKQSNAASTNGAAAPFGRVLLQSFSTLIRNAVSTAIGTSGVPGRPRPVPPSWQLVPKLLESMAELCSFLGETLFYAAPEASGDFGAADTIVGALVNLATMLAEETRAALRDAVGVVAESSFSLGMCRFMRELLMARRRPMFYDCRHKRRTRTPQGEDRVSDDSRKASGAAASVDVDVALEVEKVLDGFTLPGRVAFVDKAINPGLCHQGVKEIVRLSWKYGQGGLLPGLVFALINIAKGSPPAQSEERHGAQGKQHEQRYGVGGNVYEREVRLTAVESLDALIELTCIPSIWRPLLPGVSSALLRVSVGSLKEGSKLKASATLALVRLLLVTMHDEVTKQFKVYPSEEAVDGGETEAGTLDASAADFTKFATRLSDGMDRGRQSQRDSIAQNRNGNVRIQEMIGIEGVTSIEDNQNWWSETRVKLWIGVKESLSRSLSHESAGLRLHAAHACALLLLYGRRLLAIPASLSDCGKLKPDDFVSPLAAECIRGLAGCLCTGEGPICSLATVAVGALQGNSRSTTLKCSALSYSYFMDVVDACLSELVDSITSLAKSVDKDQLRTALAQLRGVLLTMGSDAQQALRSHGERAFSAVITLGLPVVGERLSSLNSAVDAWMDVLGPPRKDASDAGEEWGYIAYYTRQLENVHDVQCLKEFRLLLNHVGTLPANLIEEKCMEVLARAEEELAQNTRGLQRLCSVLHISCELIEGALQSNGTKAVKSCRAWVGTIVQFIAHVGADAWQAADGEPAYLWGTMVAAALEALGAAVCGSLKHTCSRRETQKEVEAAEVVHIVLPLLLTFVAHPVRTISQAALASLGRTALFEGANSLRDFLSDYLDFLSDDITQRIRATVSADESGLLSALGKDTTSRLLEGLVKYGGGKATQPLLREICICTVQRCDALYSRYGELDIHSPAARALKSEYLRLMRILLAIVKNLKEIGGEAEKKTGFTGLGARNVIAGIFVCTPPGKHMDLMATHPIKENPYVSALIRDFTVSDEGSADNEDFKGSAPEEFFVKHHAMKARNLPDQDISTKEDEDARERDAKTPSPGQTIAIEALKRASMYLSMQDLVIQRKAAEVMFEAIGLLKSKRRILLPVLAQIWPVIVSRFRYPQSSKRRANGQLLLPLGQRGTVSRLEDHGMSAQAFVLLGLLCDMIAVLVDLGGDFLSDRILQVVEMCVDISSRAAAVVELSTSPSLCSFFKSALRLMSRIAKLEGLQKATDKFAVPVGKLCLRLYAQVQGLEEVVEEVETCLCVLCKAASDRVLGEVLLPSLAPSELASALKDVRIPAGAGSTESAALSPVSPGIDPTLAFVRRAMRVAMDESPPFIFFHEEM